MIHDARSISSPPFLPQDVESSRPSVPHCLQVTQELSCFSLVCISLHRRRWNFSHIVSQNLRQRLAKQGRSPCCETSCYAVDSRDDPKIDVLYAVQQAQGLLNQGITCALHRAHWGWGKVRTFQGEPGISLELSRTLLVASTFGETSARLWEGISEDAGGGITKSRSPGDFNMSQNFRRI